ncbi:MAG: hypothetical protein US53_C0051G0002 [Candidatus Woesebacteria bacterium GW2011_GWA1_37_7]|uniref:ATP-cone domain-containing protein n=2 Tax=Candidatus Woeseibacteriota TaxID=1752722 RepID=A0A0G0H2R0_9BACT|nr:MAG: hypothetical protein US53_C0051G0002 [Candidatus Woesebacteria bacterium GW2011_GWA1_37_7]OGM18677.1 MAG: hypothetical protein A2685_00300 [Candidatus Woesebacteria bacterium RIFCSPHIGHO2_01_FULL_37_10]
MVNIKVEKRDGKLEDFECEKIIRVVSAAGLDNREAKILCDQIELWLGKIKEPKITSLQVRDQVLVEIQKINKNAAKKFIWFEKYKDKNYGVKF